MDKLNFGDVVLLKFPYTNGLTYKKRPALLINDSRDGDIIVCRITSQLYDSEYDVIIRNWQKSGLRLPSVIRVHKIATIEKSMIEEVMGKIDESVMEVVKGIVTQLSD